MNPPLRFPILMYHKIVEGSPANRFEVSWSAFQSQVKALKSRGFNTVSFSQLDAYLKEGQALPQRPVLITFDDAYSELHSLVFPFLFEHGYSATVFVPTAFIGKNNAWDLPRGYPETKLLDKKQLLELKKRGAEFGSHGMTHRALNELSVKEIRRELTGSKKELEKFLGQKIIVLAYPFNAWDELIIALAQEAGYEYGCAIDSPVKEMKDNLFLLRRVFVKPSDGLLSFYRKISGWYLWWRAVKKH